MKKSFLIFLLFFGIIFENVDAQEEKSAIFDESAFRSIGFISDLNIVVPTVIDALISFDVENKRNVVVVEMPERKVIPSILLSEQKENKISVIAKDSLKNSNAKYLVDEKKDNYVEYPVSESGLVEEVELHFSFATPVALSALFFELDSQVALPETIEIFSGTENNKKVVLSKKKIENCLIRFPETVGSNFFVKLTYIQPLRIREVNFGLSERDFKSIDHLRFLGQPNKNYLVYYNADRFVDVNFGEYPNLVGDEGVHFLPEIASQPNTKFIKADVDGDGVADEIDNCVLIKNSNQQDIDKNGRGDACDDFDRDGVINSLDNCENLPNKYQEDDDLDGVGNVCDEIESRFLQNKKWLPTISIIIVLLVVGGLIILTIRKK